MYWEFNFVGVLDVRVYNWGLMVFVRSVNGIWCLSNITFLIINKNNFGLQQKK